MTITLLDFSSGDVRVDRCQHRDSEVPAILRTLPADTPVTQRRDYAAGTRQTTAGALLREYETHGAWGW